MAAKVEREGLLQARDGAEVVLVAGVGHLLERRVGAGDVGGVVLGVVQLHDFAGDRRREGSVVVVEVRQRVVSHSSSNSVSGRSGQACVSEPRDVGPTYMVNVCDGETIPGPVSSLAI